jgi:hypothetical protein
MTTTSRFRLTRRILTGTCVAAALIGLTAAPAHAAGTPGIDVSRYQGTINWTSVRGGDVDRDYFNGDRSRLVALADNT